MKNSLISAVVASLALVSPIFAASFNRDSLVLPESVKVTVTPKDYPGLNNPNPRGWYYKCANVVVTKSGDLVACWQQSDNHTSLTSFITVSRSKDGGKPGARCKRSQNPTSGRIRRLGSCRR